MTTDLWTWGGTYFGYREDDDLWTYEGLHVGRFYDDEVYDGAGHYLGELMSGDRLITNRGKRSWRQAGFAPWARRRPTGRYGSYGGYGMYGGHEGFPKPESFR